VLAIALERPARDRRGRLSRALAAGAEAGEASYRPLYSICREHLAPLNDEIDTLMGSLRAESRDIRLLPGLRRQAGLALRMPSRSSVTARSSRDAADPEITVRVGEDILEPR